ncbi:MAG: hypothetical protein AAGA56_08575 [Myxococcota bacterium]
MDERALPRRAFTFEVKVVPKRPDWVVFSGKWRDLIDRNTRKKLLSGLPTTLVARAYLFDSTRTKRPVALSATTCRVVYDLWDEVFRIEISNRGARKRTQLSLNVEGVLRRCTEARREELARAERVVAQGSYFVALIVEVNPLSKQMLDRIQRWVARPQGTRPPSSGDSLFGSFVGLFVTQVPAADRALRFRSQRFVPQRLPRYRPKPKRRRKPVGDNG